MKFLEAAIGWFFLAIILAVLITNPNAITAAGNSIAQIGTGIVGSFSNFAGRS